MSKSEMKRVDIKHLAHLIDQDWEDIRTLTDKQPKRMFNYIHSFDMTHAEKREVLEEVYKHTYWGSRLTRKWWSVIKNALNRVCWYEIGICFSGMVCGSALTILLYWLLK